MMNTRFLWILIALPVAFACKREEVPDFNSLEEEIGYLMDKYVRMGAALGIIDSSGQVTTRFYGSLSATDPSPPDGNSLFEIGSITKTFTATLLANRVLEGRVALNDAAQEVLPDSAVTLPTWKGKAIRLKHLATHTSGIPRAPRDSEQPLPEGYDPFNPYDAYDTETVYDYLNNWCTLEFEPGTEYLYSNTGGGLLGHLLGLEDGTSFATILARDILIPLGMEQTTLDLSPGHLPMLAPGHDEQLNSVDNYTAQDIFEGAGFIKSSLSEMLLYLKANLGIPEGTGTGNRTLAGACELAQEPHYEVGTVTYGDREGSYHLSIGLGWHIHSLDGDQRYCYHGGRTNGYMAFMAFDRDHPAGFVVLFNHSIPNQINRIGEELRAAIWKYR